MPDAQPLQKLQTTLEEAFFLEQERKILERQRTRCLLEKTRRDLAAASGIRNEAVLDQLVALQVRPETVASLALAPLVEVAWCDGEVTEKERQAVLAASHHAGATQQSMDHELLSQWLTHRPGPQLFAAWEQYVKGLCELLPADDRRALQCEILEHCRQVAAASGGVLGLGAVSSAEKTTLARIAAAFGG